MNYKKFTIKNYRCYHEEQTLYFGIPNDKVGSGLTYIVGMNNSGKTTLIEGLWINPSEKIRASEMRSTGPEFCLYDIDNNLKRKVFLLKPESFHLQENPITGERFEIISSRRHWESNASDSTPSQSILDSTKYENPRIQRRL